MMFTVFVMFYLISDHAPLWIWALAGAGFVYDLYKEERAEQLLRGARLVEDAHHHAVIHYLRKLANK